MAITASIFTVSGGVRAGLYANGEHSESPTFPTVAEAAHWAVDMGAVDVNDETSPAIDVMLTAIGGRRG